MECRSGSEVVETEEAVFYNSPVLLFSMSFSLSGCFPGLISLGIDALGVLACWFLVLPDFLLAVLSVVRVFKSCWDCKRGQMSVSLHQNLGHRMTSY